MQSFNSDVDTAGISRFIRFFSRENMLFYMAECEKKIRKKYGWNHNGIYVSVMVHIQTEAD